MTAAEMITAISGWIPVADLQTMVTTILGGVILCSLAFVGFGLVKKAINRA